MKDWLQNPTERDKYFIESKSESCGAFFTDKSLQVFGKYSNEMPIMEFGCKSSKYTTTGFIGQNQPDFALFIRNICAVCGEEKGEVEKGDPARELVDKFNNWDYGDIPYLFGYYANATAVTFCVLYISEKNPININSQKIKHPDICSEKLAEFDLNRLTQIQANEFN
ncbi:8472_t:CDS:2 [Entrophospora sp. SA101]|nr:8472_t:CDS:2 [Entrophospora sp. SA101]